MWWRGLGDWVSGSLTFSWSWSWEVDRVVAVMEVSSTRLASLFVHCLLDFSSRGWLVFGVNCFRALDLRKRNWISIVSSVGVARGLREVEDGVLTFWDAR